MALVLNYNPKHMNAKQWWLMLSARYKNSQL